MDWLTFMAPLLGAALPSALLLWASADRADLASAAAGPADWLTLACGTAALWWPLQALMGVALMPPSLSLPWSLALGTCSAAAVVAARTVVAWDGPRFAPARIARAAACFGAVAFLLLFAVGMASPWGAAHLLLTSLVATAGLVVLCGGAAGWPTRWRAPVVAALAVAAALATAGLPEPLPASPWTEQALLPMLLLAIVAIVMRQRGLSLQLRGEHDDARLQLADREPIEDPLTGLPTRSHLERHLSSMVIECDREHAQLALLFIDLDGFKPVNDTYGHSAGDTVLRIVGERLKSCTRKRDLVARIGGDEFLLMMPGVQAEQEAADCAQRVIDALSRKFAFDGREVVIGCSIGIALYPAHGQPVKLIARADAAMYSAKRAGGNGFCFFNPALEDDAKERFDLLRDLRAAIELNQLELYFQPKVHAISGKVTAAEALIRWNHPTRGLLSPGVFMPIAERYGLIRHIGYWVINAACRQAREWGEKGLRMRVAINLSALQMQQEDIVDQIRGALERHRIDPRLLTCEITESVAMEDTRATQATFQALGAAGVHLSIDDFGTGYSSLAYLRKLPAEELKIDRAFVMDVEFSNDARAVIDAVVKLAHALGLKVVAEGIENERQREILQQLGCDELQGYLFARPMTARSLLIWALDERDTDSPSFATSLFTSTQGHRHGWETTSNEATLGRSDSVRASLDQVTLH
jgi:diguanylate cyclase (GGDEF)-like protein